MGVSKQAEHLGHISNTLFGHFFYFFSFIIIALASKCNRH
jgi:hypothetical protein